MQFHHIPNKVKTMRGSGHHTHRHTHTHTGLPLGITHTHTHTHTHTRLPPQPIPQRKVSDAGHCLQSPEEHSPDTDRHKNILPDQLHKTKKKSKYAT